MNSSENFTEFEAKFYPINKEEFKKKLLKIGARLATPERKMRRAIVDQRFYPQLRCDYIRVRDEGNIVRLSAKIHAREGGEVGDQQEIDVEVTDYDKTIKLVETMGFKFDLYQENLRETWEYEGAKIEIDTWPGLNTYTEIEAKSEAQVKEIAEKLDLTWKDKIITSVIEIYMRTYNLTTEQALANSKFLTFENNPFLSSSDK